MPPVKMGVKETGETWRDNYITPPYILDQLNRFFNGAAWHDMAPVEGHGVDRTTIAHHTKPYPNMWLPLGDSLSEPEWPNKCYINPPFSQYKAWAAVGIVAYKEGLARGVHKEQVWLCHTNNSSGWFKQLTEYAGAICLLRDRVKFIDPRTGSPTESTAYGKSQALIYLGLRTHDFAKAFQALGTCWELMG
jgi:hypothetical protein